LLAGDTVAGVFVAPSGVLEAGDFGASEAATHCTPTSRQIVKVTRRAQWGWEDGWRFSFDPLGDGHPASLDPVVTSVTLPTVVKVLSHVGQVLCVAKAGGWSRAGRVRTGWWLATRSASCKGRRCTSSRATHSPQRRALISSSCPTRSQSGRDRARGSPKESVMVTGRSRLDSLASTDPSLWRCRTPASPTRQRSASGRAGPASP
jgi:hypothetical protein